MVLLCGGLTTKCSHLTQGVDCKVQSPYAPIYDCNMQSLTLQERPMSLSQLSFALFAQVAQRQPECPPAGASQEVNEVAPSLAAPSASGQQAGTPLVYDGVFRLYRGVSGELLHGGWEGDWALDWQVSGCALDAPHWPPAGSHKAMVCGSYVSADGYAMSREFL